MTRRFLQRLVVRGGPLCPLLLVACATGRSEGGAAGGSSTVQCLLDQGRGAPDRADAKHGVYYEGRHGIYYEPCIGSDGRPYNHYAYWDGAEYLLLGNNETSIDPQGLNEEPSRGGIAFYEYPEQEVTCQGNRCQSKTRLIDIRNGSERRFSLDWVGCKVSDHMEVLDFDAGPLKVSCSSFQVKGEACRQAVSSLKSLIESKRYPVPPKLVLTDKWCD